MVKFGQRLVEELVKDGWESSYVQYGALKKLIKAVSSHEVKGEMVLAFENQERFITSLQHSIQSASDFYQQEADRVLVSAADVRKQLDGLKTTSSTSSPDADAETGHAADVRSPSMGQPLPGPGSASQTLEGIDVMDALVLVRKELQELRMFRIVNREAVRKILKKYHKKTRAGTEEVHGTLEGMLDGTPLDESHATAQLVSKALALISDAEAQVSLKSRAHAEHMARAVAAITTPPRRPSNTPTRTSKGRSASPTPPSKARSASPPASSAGSACEARLDLENVVVGGVGAAERDLEDSQTKECKLSCLCGLKLVSRVEVADWWSDPRKRIKMLVQYGIAFVVIACCIVVLVTQPTRLKKLSVIGGYASVLVAVANGGNDIANSVGTSVGAKALTLRQAIVFGLIAEALGAMTLGSLVAKTISPMHMAMVVTFRGEWRRVAWGLMGSGEHLDRYALAAQPTASDVTVQECKQHKARSVCRS